MRDKNLAVENGPRYNVRRIDAEVYATVLEMRFWYICYLTHIVKII